MGNKSHAAMCIYCGKVVIYDTREVTDMEIAHQMLMDHDKHCEDNPLVRRLNNARKALEVILNGPWPDEVDSPEDQARFDASVARAALQEPT